MMKITWILPSRLLDNFKAVEAKQMWRRLSRRPLRCLLRLRLLTRRRLFLI
jgi:hypothetical protein